MKPPVSRILILDDSPARHRRLRRILEATGYKQVRSAFTASEAITALGHAALMDDPFQMVCLDHDLGTMDDGRTVCRWLADLSEYPRDLRILIHSQNPSGAQQMEGILRDGGFTDIVQKPYKSA